jgi:alpha-1,6-mannosyltransferase
MFTKTLHLTNAYHEHSGGIRTMYQALLDQANREHRLMRLVVPASRDGVERVGRFGVIYAIRAPRAPVVDRRYRMVLPHRFLWPGAGRLWEIFERESPDILEVSDKYSLCYFAGLVRKRWPAAERPTLIGLSCERLDDNLAAHVVRRERAGRAARAYLGHVYLGMFDAHVANSEYTAEELRDAMVPKHQRAVHVCPMGVTLPPAMTPAARQAARQELIATCGGRDVPLVIYAGRLSSEKHVDVLPAVMAALAAAGSGAHLVIAGDGPMRGGLEHRLHAAAAGRAHFLGHLTDRSALTRHIAASDVFLHPNPREPFGIGPLEAMAAGVPLVAPDEGGVRTYATADNAWLTRAEPDAFATAIRLALDGGAENRRRVANALLTAERFTWPAAASRIFQTYDRLHTARVARSPSRAIRPAAAAPGTDHLTV